MPDILVEVRGTWLAESLRAFLEAVHHAVAQTLVTPADEPLVRLIEHAASNYLIPHSAGERFTRIEIVMFAGRFRRRETTIVSGHDSEASPL